MLNRVHICEDTDYRMSGTGESRIFLWRRSPASAICRRFLRRPETSAICRCFLRRPETSRYADAFYGGLRPLRYADVFCGGRRPPPRMKVIFSAIDCRAVFLRPPTVRSASCHRRRCTFPRHTPRRPAQPCRRRRRLALWFRG